jgi:serine/threonine-protein kinase
LQHPNIVTIYDVGEFGGNLFLAMEFVSGGSLADTLTGPPTAVPVADRIRIVAEVADALGHAHERGVIHRDIKPANILLTDIMAAKVTDFGIGKIVWGDVELTSAGQMVGSPAYMSPEQVRGEKLDARSDIFSLGIVLYQTLTFRRPFPAETLTSLVMQILNDDPDDPATVRDDVPPEIGGVLQRMLAKNRDDRYSDAHEIAQELRDLARLPGVISGLSDSRVRRPRTVAPPSEGPTIQIVMKMPGRTGLPPAAPERLPDAVETFSGPSPIPAPLSEKPVPKLATAEPPPPKKPSAEKAPEKKTAPPPPPEKKGPPAGPPPAAPAKARSAQEPAPPPSEPEAVAHDTLEATGKDRIWRYTLLGLSVVILISALIFGLSEVRRASAVKAVPTPTPLPLPTFPVSALPTMAVVLPAPAETPLADGGAPVVSSPTPAPAPASVK